MFEVGGGADPSPTFLDIYLTRMTDGKHSNPQHFKDIFERGIDPDVDDPTKIHVCLTYYHFADFSPTPRCLPARRIGRHCLKSYCSETTFELGFEVYTTKSPMNRWPYLDVSVGPSS